MLKIRIAAFYVVIVIAVAIVIPVCAQRQPARTPSGVEVVQIERVVDQVMQSYIGVQAPGAAVAVVKDGEIVFAKGYGFANIRDNVAMDAHKTYMEAGSISKLFTWTAVMQLVEQEKINLDSDIRQYLPPHFINLRYPVTMKQLMTHTAGFEEHVEGLFVAGPDKLIPLERYVGRANQPRQIYRPGTIIAYSNYGTNLAGYIVERIAGMPFEEYVQTNIFMPLQMEQATFVQNYNTISAVVAGKSSGYVIGDSGFIERPRIYINDMPAGSLNITAENMGRFMIAQLDFDNTASSRLFQDRHTLAVMQTLSFTHNALLPGNAHGFWERFAGSHRVLEHGGNTDSFSSLLSIVPDENFGICILTNVGADMSGLRSDLINALIGTTYRSPASDPSLDHSRQVAGRYRFARAVQSNIFKVTSILGDQDMIVSADGPGGITLRVPSMGVQNNYIETAPYLFERMEPSDSILEKAGMNASRIYFVANEQGGVEQLSFGVITDALPVSFFQTMLFSIVFLSACTLLFIGGLAAGGCSAVSSYRAKQQWLTGVPLRTRWDAVLSAIGIAMIGNFIVTAIRLLHDPFQPLHNFNVNIGLVWLLTGVFAGMVVWRVKNRWRQSQYAIGRQLFSSLLILAFAGLCIFLYSYNFYFFR